MKTPALQESLRFLKGLIDEAKERYDREAGSQERLRLVHKAKAEAAKAELKKGAKKKDTTDEELERLAEEAAAAQRGGGPKLKRYMVNDATVEKLGEILCENPNGVLEFRDELSGLFKTLDKHGHEADRAFYLESWAGRARSLTTGSSGGRSTSPGSSSRSSGGSSRARWGATCAGRSRGPAKRTTA